MQRVVVLPALVLLGLVGACGTDREPPPPVVEEAAPPPAPEPQVPDTLRSDTLMARDTLPGGP